MKVKTRDLDVRGIRELPTRLSLRPFCPTPQDQGAEPSCAVWATVYGALTVQQAVYKKARASDDINKIAYSKSFVFNQLRNNLHNDILPVESVFSFLRTEGVCLAATFRNDLPISEKPDALAVYEARNGRLAAFSEVYDPDTTIRLKRQIQRFKRMLADSIPLVVGMRLPFSFYNQTGAVFNYDHSELLDSAAHALCLIGYDDIDSTFECMNSWGVNWGDKGFVRIRYTDMFRLLCCAYRLTPQFATERKSRRPSGVVTLRKSVGYDQLRIPQYEEIRVGYDSLARQYEPLRGGGDFENGFQIVLRDTPPQWRVYVFNVDENNHLSVFHQDTVGTPATGKTIPGEETKLEMDDQGVNWICVLYAPAPVDNLKAGLEDYLNRQSPGSISERIGRYFEPILAPNTSYNPYRMGFSLAKGAEPKAVLLFLKIEN